MLALLYQGGPLFMGILTLLFLTLLIVAFVNGKAILQGNVDNADETRRKIGYIKSVGTLALVIGILGQLIGLYSGFVAIEAADGVSMGILAGGLKVSMISTMYGILIYIIGYLIWLGLSWKLK